jgi:hypothetical protein
MAQETRKPRVTEIRVDFGRHQVLSGMNVAADGTLTLFDESGAVVAPELVETGSAYQRANKHPKVLTRVATDPSQIQLDSNRELTRFDWVFAVDTNTEDIGSVHVSITVPTLIRDIEIKPPRWDAKLVPQDAFEFHDCTSAPEAVGWCHVIRRIEGDSRFHKSKIAVIVDSELGRLTSINARKEPIEGSFYLPPGFQLIYGTRDGGTQEHIANAAIADCDRDATKLLDRIAKENCAGNFHQAPGMPYRCFRYWTAPGKEVT